MSSSRSTSSPFFWTLAALAAVLGWDASGLDFPLSHLFGDSTGFALQYDWVLSSVLHDMARRLAWLPTIWLVAGIWWPTAVLRRLTRAERIQLAATTVGALLLIAVIKQSSGTSCPWDLAEFGRHATRISHWAWGVSDGGGGRCFPAGHASAGFAFFGGYFVLRARAPKAAWMWFAGALAMGFLLGGAQVMRGAHFMSHTLWTGWLCWTFAWAIDAAVSARRLRSSLAADPGTPALPAAQAPAN